MALVSESLTHDVIGAAIDVHRELGPGLLENVYEACFCHELQLREIPFESQKELPVIYKGRKLDFKYRMDVVIADQIIVELKSVEKLLPVFEAQLMTYLRITRIKVGLLINFNVPVLKDGIVRRVL